MASTIKVQTRLLDSTEADAFDGWEERLDQWEKDGFKELFGSQVVRPIGGTAGWSPT